MDSREIVQRAIRFQSPPRLPVRFDAIGVSDIAAVGLNLPEGMISTGTGVDQWGCRWEQSEVHNMGQVVGNPITDLSQIDGYPMPDYTQEHWYAGLDEKLDRARGQGKYVLAGIFMILFERMHTLLPMDTVLMGLLADRPAMETLADRIVETQLKLVTGYAERASGRIDGISMTDDWGSQHASFVSYDLWMDFFAPRYRRLFDAMHDAGFDVWLHSCGKVTELLEGFIDVGVNVVNLQQPRALGIAEVGERYRGRITFESLADIQATLPTGDAARIRADAAELAEHWMTPAGGFVFSDYGDSEAIGTGAESKLTMYEAFSEASERIHGQALPTPQLEKSV